LGKALLMDEEKHCDEAYNNYCKSPEIPHRVLGPFSNLDFSQILASSRFEVAAYKDVT